MKHIYILTFLLIGLSMDVSAGNPDRQGQAGAYELLMNPWARSSGLHSMTTANVQGVEALRINPAGLGSVEGTEINFGHTRYFVGTDIKLNSFGLGRKVGKSGVLGLSLMAVDFGDIQVTTANQPEGTGAIYSPQFFNLGISYSYLFENNISAGATIRVVSESTSSVTASGIALDAGIQYVAGEKDNIRFGISLRNVGSPLVFKGEGLSFPVTINTSNGTEDFPSTVDSRSDKIELPSMLNLGGSYDFFLSEKSILTVVANFTSNSFGQDYLGGGLEFKLNEMFALRGGYRYEVGMLNEDVPAPVYNGICGGLSFDVPFKKGGTSKIGFDYAYRATNPWSGTHNIGVRLTLD